MCLGFTVLSTTLHLWPFQTIAMPSIQLQPNPTPPAGLSSLYPQSHCTSRFISFSARYLIKSSHVSSHPISSQAISSHPISFRRTLLLTLPLLPILPLLIHPSNDIIKRSPRILHRGQPRHLRRLHHRSSRYARRTRRDVAVRDR